MQRPIARTLLFLNGNGNVVWNYGFNAAGQIGSVGRDNDAYAFTGHYAVNRAYATNGLNQYSAAGSATFAYDPNGNLISDGNRTYLYDIENRMVGGNGAALIYDPLGRLFQVTSATTGTTRFLYDGDALIAEYDGANAMLRRHIHWPGADLPMTTYEDAGLGTLRQLYADHQGSVVALADENGAIVAVNRYDEYGIPGAGNSGRFQYTGQIWLSELGMYYYKARIYSPTLGRFMQTDPIGYEGGNNLYGYVANDPVNYVDVTGQQRTAHIPVPGCAGCHSTSTPTQMPTTVPVRLPDIGGALRNFGSFLCQNSWICSALTEGDQIIRTDGTGKVHDNLPAPEDVDPDDLEESIDNLEESIDLRQQDMSNYPDGRRNGTPEERDQWRTQQQHRDRIADETRLRDRLRRRLEDERR